MADESNTPLEVIAPRGSDTFQVNYADGHEVTIPHQILRGFCPCAGCQGHTGVVRYVEGGSPELGEIVEVGDYALQLSWADGHNTGIYSFSFLRQLCQCPACASADPLTRKFGH